MQHDLYLTFKWFWRKRKIDNFDPYNVVLDIAMNIPMLLMTGIQGHKYEM